MLDFAVLPVTPFQQNATLLWCKGTRQAVLIDPGGEAQRLLDWARGLNVQIRQILLTHGHLDHVGAASECREALQVPILGPHQADQFLLEALPKQCALFGFPPIQPLLPDRWLGVGEKISLGESQLEVIHCPGHTPGHLVFFSREDGWAQVGDVLFQGAIGRTDLPGGDAAQLLDSIRTQLFPLGDGVRILPGHGPASTIGRERRTNPFLVEEIADPESSEPKGI